MSEKSQYTPVHPALDPKTIFERGFVTNVEIEAIDLAKFGCKVRLVDDDGNGEGIWGAIITNEDRALYEGTTVGETFRIILLNNALCFHPNHSWGRVLEGKTNGSKRPIFKHVDQIPRFKETHDAYLEEHPIKKNDEASSQ